jgi:parallel beta-helix repeat protein
LVSQEILTNTLLPLKQPFTFKVRDESMDRWTANLKPFLAMVLLLAPLASIMAVAQFAGAAGAGTITVPEDYPTIQAAVNAAAEGDTIFVKKGIYNENLTVNKSLSLVGESAGSTVVTGEGNTALLVQHDNVNVTGFTFRRPSTMRWYYGVHLLNVQRCNVFGNRIESTFIGIWLVDASFNNIYENTLNGDWNGIHLRNSHQNNVSNNYVTGSHDWGISTEGSSNNIIMNNHVASSGWGGIGLDGGSPNRNNLIAENVVTMCGDIGIGITSMGSVSNRIVANNITGTGSEDYGDVAILLAWDSNLVEGNRLTGNQGGIYLEASQNNTVRRNLIENNQGGGGVRIHGFPSRQASSNVIYENNIVNNAVKLSGNLGANSWDSEYRGNYWNDYNGTDADGDGVGDTPYTIDSGNIDRYPLMAPAATDVDITEFLPLPTPIDSSSPSPSASHSPSPSPTPIPYPTSTPITAPSPSQAPSPTLMPSPTLTPSPSPSPTEQPMKTLEPQPSAFETEFIYAAVGTAAIIIFAVVAVVLRRRQLNLS